MTPHLNPIIIIPLFIIILNIIHFCKITKKLKEKIIGSFLIILTNMIIGKILYTIALSDYSGGGDLGIIVVLLVILQITPIITYYIFMTAYSRYKKNKKQN